ncbi:dihydroorotate dehydrogenase [Thermoproteus tenax]|uniref:Dihydroorotate dehydrogenase n=1 Tax=Thermoproteus tenax (strain ATCC 35583 / DSM 2078 / JCM 9277 / NBRC 100435 / Kra 1) TaxID=768679 RepID=G4RPF6_THETK|nr:dihydroorotate dehydrogenase [Thermoproteus tenax]CCC81451.1 Dihydroorotate dehydrogenase [Thermoproteus tenax Kra 1]
MFVLLSRIIEGIPPEITRRIAKPLFMAPLPSCRPKTAWRIGEIRTHGPLGVAAGFDKEGLYTRALSAFCPGFIVVGSTTARHRRGNKPPLTARLRPLSLVNAMGLPSPGIPTVLARLKKVEYPIILSIAGFSPEELLAQILYVEKYGNHISAIEVNLSSPTYKGIWDRVSPLISSKKPLFIKVGPTSDLRFYAEMAKRRGYGLVLTNTLPVSDERIGVGRGGVSGLWLYPILLKMLNKAREYAGRDVPIMAVGGVMSCRQVRDVMKLADGVQMLTGILYFTPYLIKRLNECALDSSS